MVFPWFPTLSSTDQSRLSLICLICCLILFRSPDWSAGVTLPWPQQAAAGAGVVGVLRRGHCRRFGALACPDERGRRVGLGQQRRRAARRRAHGRRQGATDVPRTIRQKHQTGRKQFNIFHILKKPLKCGHPLCERWSLVPRCSHL